MIPTRSAAWLSPTLLDATASCAELLPEGANEELPVLLVLEGASRGRRLALTPGRYTVGRAPEADLQVDDERISRIHCRLWVERGRVTLEDCGSRNGTVLGGERIVTPQPLAAQAQFSIGQTVFKLVYKTSAELHLEEELFFAATSDALTGLPNRRWFDEQAARLLAQSQRHQMALSALMIDLDHFKAINDRYGHPTGDAVLVAVAWLIRGQKRQEDLICRYGGEEFLLLLPLTDADGAAQLAERIRAAVAAEPVQHGEHRVPVTVSAGVGDWVVGERLGELIARVDAALYEAKRSGRDRVVCAPRPQVSSG